MLYVQRNAERSALRIHMLMCNNVSVTPGWRQCRALIYMTKASFYVKFDAHGYRV